MIIFRHFDKISSNIFHIICQNLIRQFLKVTFNEIFCKLALFLFYGTPAYYIASGNSCWLLWPKCWLETEFDNRLRLRFSLLIQLILGKCVPQLQQHRKRGEIPGWRLIFYDDAHFFLPATACEEIPKLASPTAAAGG